MQKRSLFFIISFALITFYFTIGYTQTSIAVDGNINDWNDSMQVDVDPNWIESTGEISASLDIKDIFITNDNNNLYVRIDINETGHLSDLDNKIDGDGNKALIRLYLDTDLSNSTGFTYGSWVCGGDYYINITDPHGNPGYEVTQEYGILQYTGSDGMADTWVEVSGYQCSIARNSSDNIIEVAIPRAAIGETASENESTGVIVFSEDPTDGWNNDVAPDDLDNAQYVFSYTSDASSAQSPVISVQPQSKTKNEGESATFSITASGTAPLTYQWYLNGSVISGAQSSSYTTPSLSLSDNGNEYYCVVTNGYGSVTSNTATVTVNSGASDNIVLVSNGVAQYTIYYGKREGNIVDHSALELGMTIDAIAGSSMPATNDSSVNGNLIVVGRNNPLVEAIPDIIKIDEIKDDGFRIIVYNNNLYIVGAIDRGTMYGVYHFLDKYLGMRWYSPEFSVTPSNSTISVPVVNDLQNPRFTYREIFNRDSEDGYYRAHNLLNGNRWDTHRQYLEYDPDIDTWSEDGPAGGANFKDIVSDVYHNGGQILMMSEGARSQAASYYNNFLNTESIVRWYSFSQEDNGWEPDEDSQAFADAHGGKLSAPVVDMVIDVAQRIRQEHPNAHLSTYAYQWSFDPPTGMTIPDYVMIEAAPIEANFGYAYNDATHNPQAAAAFNGWKDIASTMGVWDYITNFQNYLQPWPNIYPMCENIQYFASIDAMRSYFGQGSYNTEGGEFAELRAWVAARLLWNPNQDYHALVEDFCDGYYGPASTYIKQYIDLLHQSFVNSGDRISSKQRITSDYLNLDFIQQADNLMASADAAASGEYSKHVHDVRLGVDMTILLREHLYERDAQEAGKTWIHDASRRSRFEQYCSEAHIDENYSEDASLSSLLAAMDIDRVYPADPDIVSENDEWIDFQDLDFSICCGAVLAQDDLASDHGAAKLDNQEWAITLKLDMLPPGPDWDLYAYVRADVKSGVNPNTVAINIGTEPGSWISPTVADLQDGQYHVYQFPEMPVKYQTGADVWFSCGEGANNIYVDRIVAKKVGGASKIAGNAFNSRDSHLPKKFALHNNYPNPFNPSTTILYDLPKDSQVKITVYDINGEKVKTLIDRYVQAGYHNIVFDASKLSSGIYFYQIKAGNFSSVKRMLLIK